MSFLLTFLFFAGYTWGAPLSDEAIRKAKKIVVVSGTFDPWSLADQAHVDQLIKSGKADLVIAVPTDVGASNIPLSVENRLMLMNEVLKENPSVVYPDSNSMDELMSRIKKITSVPVSQVKAPVSGENIRAFLSQNSGQYFSRDPALAPAGYDRKVFERILENGFYMGQRPGTSTFVQRTKDWLTKTAIDLGVFDSIKHVVNGINARPNLKEFDTGSEKIQITKHLGAGAQGDAYITKIDGKNVVIKIAKGSDASREVMWNSVLNHQWLKKTSSIQVPELIAFDPDGKWISMNFVEGTQLDKLIAQNNGEIPGHIEEELKKFYAEAQRVYRQNNIVLDINTQNIFVNKEGKLILVDFGPLPPSRTLAPTYAANRALWIADGKRLLGKVSPQLNGKCLKNVLRNYLNGV